MHILQYGVPIDTTSTPLDLMKKTLHGGNHSSVDDYLPHVWKKLAEGVRRNRCLVFNGAAASDIRNLLVAPLGAVVTNKVRIIHGFSSYTDFSPGTKVD